MVKQESFFDRKDRESAEATVALSHEPDHNCEICRRVRARNKLERRYREGG